MNAPAAVAATALSQSRVAAFMWRNAGELRLSVVLKATFRMHHEAHMEQIAPEPFLAGEESEPADDLIPSRQTADVWVVGYARKPHTAEEALLRLWVSLGSHALIDRVVTVEPEEWAKPGKGGRLELSRTALGPVAHRSGFETGSGIIELPAGSDRERFQWAPHEQRLTSLAGSEWVGLSGAVLEPFAVISQLPHVRATAHVYDRAAPTAARLVTMAADLIAIDAGAWTCSLTWHGEVDLSLVGETVELHVVGGVTTFGEELATHNPFSTPNPLSLLRETARGVTPRKFATLPFRRPPEGRARADVEARPGAKENGAPATPFDAPPGDEAPLSAASSSVTSRRHARKLGTTMVEAFVERPATPFDAPRRAPSQAPPPGFTEAPPSSLPAATPFDDAAWKKLPTHAGGETLDDVGEAWKNIPTHAGGETLDDVGAAWRELPAHLSGETLEDVGDALREPPLPFAQQSKRPEALRVRPAPASDPTVLPFRRPKKGFGAAFLAAFEALDVPQSH